MGYLLQNVYRKLQEGVCRRKVILCKERERSSGLLQEAPAWKQSFTLDYCTDMKEIQKVHQDSSKNTHALVYLDNLYFSFLLDGMPVFCK